MTPWTHSHQVADVTFGVGLPGDLRSYPVRWFGNRNGWAERRWNQRFTRDRHRQLHLHIGDAVLQAGREVRFSWGTSNHSHCRWFVVQLWNMKRHSWTGCWAHDRRKLIWWPRFGKSSGTSPLVEFLRPLAQFCWSCWSVPELLGCLLLGCYCTTLFFLAFSFINAHKWGWTCFSVY